MLAPSLLFALLVAATSGADPQEARATGAAPEALPSVAAARGNALTVGLTRAGLRSASFVDVASLRDTLVGSGVRRVRFALGAGEVLRASVGSSVAGANPRAWFVALGEELRAAGVEAEAWILPDRGAEDAALQAAARGVLGAVFAGTVLPERPTDVVYGLDGGDASALFRAWERRTTPRFHVYATLDGTTGSISTAARAALAGLDARIHATYGTDVLAAAVLAGAVETGQDASALVDGDGATSCSVEAGGDALEFGCAAPIAFDRVAVACEGDVDAAFQVFAEVEDASGAAAFELVAQGTLKDGRPSVPCARHVVTSSVRLRLEPAADAEAAASVSSFALYESPPTVRIEPEGELSLSPIPVALSTRSGAHVRYTLDGSTPDETSPRYTQPLRLLQSAELRARAFDARGASPDEARARFTVVTDSDWRDGVTFVRAPTPGLRVESFEVSIDSLVQLERHTALARREVAGVDVRAHAGRAQRVALRYAGFLRVPDDGLYTFELSSDDGSR
ncbi:MAG: chitobiase/beta-hexosaminidase C-terminal domain-containing protein, partial [Planctomycetota bacterium]